MTPRYVVIKPRYLIFFAEIYSNKLTIFFTNLRDRKSLINDSKYDATIGATINPKNIIILKQWVTKNFLPDQPTTNLGVRGSNPLERTTFNITVTNKN